MTLPICDDYLTTGQVAGYFGVCSRTVNKWCVRELLVSHRLPGARTHWRINRYSVADLLRATGLTVPTALTNC